MDPPGHNRLPKLNLNSPTYVSGAQDNRIYKVAYNRGYLQGRQDEADGQVDAYAAGVVHTMAGVVGLLILMALLRS